MALLKLQYKNSVCRYRSAERPKQLVFFFQFIEYEFIKKKVQLFELQLNLNCRRTNTSIKFKHIIMNPSLGFIQLIFYYPVLSLFLYTYLVIFVPKISTIGLNNIYSRFISKLKIKKENNL